MIAEFGVHSQVCLSTAILGYILAKNTLSSFHFAKACQLHTASSTTENNISSRKRSVTASFHYLDQRVSSCETCQSYPGRFADKHTPVETHLCGTSLTSLWKYTERYHSRFKRALTAGLSCNYAEVTEQMMK